MIVNNTTKDDVQIKVEPPDLPDTDDQENQTEDHSGELDQRPGRYPEVMECIIKTEPTSLGEECSEMNFIGDIRTSEIKDRIVEELLHRVSADDFFSTPDTIYECFHCDHKTPDLSKLRVHVEVRHLSLGGFPLPVVQLDTVPRRKAPPGKRWRNKCSFCGERFDRRSDLREHLAEVHRGKSAFPCELCSYEAVTRADLKSHMMFRHTKDQPYKCGYCSYSSASSGAVRRHLSCMHPDEEVNIIGKKTAPGVPQEKRNLKCELCDYEAKFPSVLSQHVLTKHSKMRPFSCSYCSFQTSGKGRLANHVLARHTDERPYRCAVCDKSFFEKKRLKRHVEVKHLQVRFTCEHCGFAAGYRDNLRRHIITRHTNERKYSCDHCSYKSAQSGNLKRHVLLKHSLEKPLSCKICWYVTENPAVLKRHHLAKHTEGKDMRYCPHCSYSTNRKAYLRKHMLSRHCSDKPHKCPFCNYSTSLSYNLKMHIRSKHTDERPYSCSFCDFRAPSVQKVKYHINSKHTGKTKSSYNCKICDFVADMKKTLNEHIRTKHSKRRSISCPHCDFVTKNKTSFRTHAKTHGLENGFSCSFCLFSTERPKILENHMWRKHSHEYLASQTDQNEEKKFKTDIASVTSSETLPQQTDDSGNSMLADKSPEGNKIENNNEITLEPEKFKTPL